MKRKGSQATPQYFTNMNKKYFLHFDNLKNEVIFEPSILSVLMFKTENLESLGTKEAVKNVKLSKCDLKEYKSYQISLT